MRFLLGLLAGAFATILLASTTDVPTETMVDDLQSAWSNAVRKMTALLPRVEALAEIPQDAPADESTPLREAEYELDFEGSSLPAREVPIAIDLPVATPIGSVEPVEFAVLEAPATVTRTTSVWDPFHSEVSATGFAKRLSLQLGYPFEVVKQAPARYLVVFDYDSDAERSLLERQIAVLTGYKHP